MFAHLPSSKAFRAAFTASSTSALSPSATGANTSSLAGLTVSKVLPDLAATHLPLISIFLGACRNSSAARFFAPRAAVSTEIEAAMVFSLRFQLSTVQQHCFAHLIRAHQLCLSCFSLK